MMGDDMSEIDQFEKWLLDEPTGYTMIDLQKYDGYYVNYEIERMWLAWQARAQQGADSGEALRRLNTKPPANQVRKGKVAIPRDVAEAKGMYLVGYSWLKHNAPDELSTQTGAGQWIPCSQRLPTEDDEDADGKVWLCWPYREFIERVERRTASFCDGFHWMPTGLRKPQPPQECK